VTAFLGGIFFLRRVGEVEKKKETGGRERTRRGREKGRMRSSLKVDGCAQKYLSTWRDWGGKNVSSEDRPRFCTEGCTPHPCTERLLHKITYLRNHENPDLYSIQAAIRGV